MAYHVSLFLFIVLTGTLGKSEAGKCDRKLDGTFTPPGNLEAMFFITFWTLNKTDTIDQYMPNTRYIGEYKR